MSYELEKSLGFKINQTANKLNNKYNQLLQSFDIAPEQRATLEIIKYEADVNQTKIANILGKDKTTISRTLNTLENKNLITKSQIDKRTNLIQLTQKGEDILNDSFSSVKDFRKKLTSNLSEEEINQLVSLLEKVALSVEKES
jgi:DNA-binding MarR family transcriptional regulator